MRLFTHLRTRLGAAEKPKAKRRPSARFRPRLENLEGRQMLSAGALDPTFGSGGVASPPATYNGGANAIAVYSPAEGSTAGDIVAAGAISVGRSGANFAVVRYTPNGTPDASFGSGGVATASFGKAFLREYTNAAAIQTDGKIDAAGFAVTSNLSTDDFALARYNVNGSLDTSFGVGGKVTTSFSGVGGGFDYANAEVIQPDGRIVLAGRTTANGSGGFNIALARYNANGSLDATFGNGGEVNTSHTLIPGALAGSGGTAYIRDAALQADGKILVGGYVQMSPASPASADGFVARYNANGTLDASFGNGGFVTLPDSNVPSADGHMAVEPDGEILVAHGRQLTLLQSDGSVDTSFTPPTISAPGSVALEPNGEIVVNGGNSSLVARFLPNGVPDTTFGNGGVVTLPNTNSMQGVLAIQADGKIDLLGGINAMVERLLPSEPQIGSFTASADPVASGAGTTLTASNITDGNPNAWIAQVTFYYIDGGGNQQVLGHGTQTSAGVWTLNYTAGLPSGTYTIYVQAKDSYGVTGIGPSSLSLQVL